MARKLRTTPVIEHYAPQLSAAIQAKDKAQIATILRNLTVAAWLAGIKKAQSHSAAIADGVQSQNLAFGAPTDAPTNWGDDQNIPGDDLPSDLAIRLSDVDDYADNIVNDDSDQDPDDQAQQISTTQAATLAALAASAAFLAGGVSQWNLQLDSPQACQACQDAADDGPYDVGSGPDLPIHNNCECESVPAASDESRAWHGFYERLNRMAKYDADDLKALADKGHAMTGDDGSISYPINDKEDLDKAIHAVGRGKADHDKIRAHIIKCAKALSLEEEIPDNWNADGSLSDAKSATPPRRPRQRRELALQSEMRRFHANEIRAGKQTNDGLVPLEGVVIRYGVPYEVHDMAGTFTETIHRGAAFKVLAGAPDIRMLFNHEGMPLARTGAEASLETWEEDDGLHIRALVDPRQTLANDLIVALERGTVTQMSVGMQVDPDADQWSGEDERGLPNVRNIFGLDNIFDASAVTYPASKTTTLALASRMADLPPEVTVRTQRLWEMAREGRKGIISQADSDTLMHLIERLSAARSDGAFVESIEDTFDMSDEERSELLTATETLLGESRNVPTKQDANVAKAIAAAHQAVGDALVAQAKDPDNNTDPDDQKVWKHLSSAHDALKNALHAQAADGNVDAEPTDDDMTDGAGGADGTLGGNYPGAMGNLDGTGSRAAVLSTIDEDMLRLKRRPRSS